MVFKKKKKDKIVETIKVSREESLDEKYKKGLKKSRESFIYKLKKLVTKYREIDDDYFNELEEILIMSDVGAQYVDKLIKKIKEEAKINKAKTPEQSEKIIFDYLFKNYLKDSSSDENDINLSKDKLNVILVIGVNGVGKTTSIGKLSFYLKNKGYKITLAAADTFRAGAVDQLEIWSKKISIDIIKPEREGQDPASVVYLALEKAISNNSNILIIDTAGRLENKKNLMAELEKINKIIKAKSSETNIETLLVLDATTGQNGVHQASGFNEVTKLTGIILTKMDSSSKGGIILSIKDYFNIPVKFIGLGEKLEDFEQFDLVKYLNSLIGEDLYKNE